jgi:GNAT superfamily N-acetyltransferase
MLSDMENEVEYRGQDNPPSAVDFMQLAARVWPGAFEVSLIERALATTRNFSAWHEGRLIGCARLLSDGYLFSTVPEVLVDPDYRRAGVGSKLMQLLWKASPTSLGFGVQPGNEEFFETLGYETGMAFYHRRKPRRKQH